MNKGVRKYAGFSTLGFFIFVLGCVLTRFKPPVEGIGNTLPYILVGIGAGLFGGHLGTAIEIHLLSKNSPAATQREIERNDERNMAIMSQAKAKAYDLMIFTHGALLLAAALMKIHMHLILAFSAAYVFIVCSMVFYVGRLSKEM